MPNSLIDAYRKQMEAQGQPDTRDDFFVMQDLIPLVKDNPDLLQKYPDFAQEYGQYRDAAAPSLAGEFGRALKSGTEGAAATYTGLGAIAGIPGAAEESKKLDEEASEAAPTISSMEDIAPGETGMSKVFSKDTARYVAGKLGSALPSLAEMAGVSLVGAAIGSAVEPGVGTVAGAAEGVVEEILGKGIIKSAIKSLVEEKAAAGLTEEGVADAIRAGDQQIADRVTQQAKAIAARRAEAGTNLANVYGMSAGGIENETHDPEVALGLGAAAAITAAPPFLSLPARVVKGLFPKLSGEAAQAAAKDLVGQKSAELLAKLGRAGSAAAVGTGGVLGMEAASIVAKNITQGKDPLDVDDADWKRLREAAVGGALASAPFAALAMRGDTEAAPPLQRAPAPAPEPGETGPQPAPEPPAPESVTPTLDLTRKVAGYDPEMAAARLSFLADVSDRNEEQEKEYQLLRASAPSASIPAPVPEAEANVDIGPRNPEVSTGTGIETPAETKMIADWKAQIATETKATSDIPSVQDAGFESQEHFDREYAANHERDAYELPEEYLRRVYCQRAA